MRYEAWRMPTRAGWCVFKAHDPTAPVVGVFADEVTAARVAAIANEAYAESGADGLAAALQVYARRPYWTAPSGDGPRTQFLPAGDNMEGDGSMPSPTNTWPTRRRSTTPPRRWSDRTGAPGPASPAPLDGPARGLFRRDSVLVSVDRPPRPMLLLGSSPMAEGKQGEAHAGR